MFLGYTKMSFTEVSRLVKVILKAESYFLCDLSVPTPLTIKREQQVKRFHVNILIIQDRPNSTLTLPKTKGNVLLKVHISIIQKNVYLLVHPKWNLFP